MLYVLNKESGGHNIDEMRDGRWEKLMEFFEKTHAQYVIVDANMEHELKDLHTDDKAPFRQEYGMFDDGISALIKGGYDLLGLMSFSRPAKMRLARGLSKKEQPRPRPAPLFIAIFRKSLFGRR